MNLVISLNKPKDISSQGAVSRVKGILRVKKAGHTGTLDPMATGLLLVCINKATKLATYLSGVDKEYSAVMKLGESTDTQDAYGEVLEKVEPINVSESEISEALLSFKGIISQTPPMYSALKHKGKPLYKYAREGEEIARKPREVNIRSIELLNIDLPYVSFRAACSKGTYIRTLCDDIGKKLGVGAHMTELERTAISSFRIEDALTFEELEALESIEAGNRGIYSMDDVLSWMPELILDEAMVRPVMHGNPIKGEKAEGLSDDARSADGIRIKSPDGELLSLGKYNKERKMIMMDIVFSG